jgi:hypothetical protein
MQSGNQDDFFHLFYSESESPSEGEPGIDMLDHPITKIASRASVLTLSVYWKR